MLYEPGMSGNPKGKPKGALAKTTKEIKLAFQLILSENTDNFNIWIQKIAEKDPAKAMSLIIDMAEFILPKLQRSTVEFENEDFNQPKQVFIINGNEIDF